MSDDWNSHWETFSSSTELNPAQLWRRKLIMQLLDLDPGSKVLDVGSGQGDFARHLLDRKKDVNFTGLELSHAGVMISTKKVPEARFEQVDLLQDEIADLDLFSWASHVVCSEVLEHLDRPEILLKNALRYAAEGACVVLTVPRGPRTKFDIHIGHRKHYTQKDLGEVMEAAGITVEKIETRGFPFFNLYRLAVMARGQKLIDDVRKEKEPGIIQHAMMHVFNILLKFNFRKNRFGWQLVGVGTVNRNGISSGQKK